MICIRLVGGRTRRSLAVGLLSVTAALAGCNGSSKPSVPAATVPQATTTTNPFAVPAVIDEAYVNRVLAGLDEAVGDMVRLVVSSQTIPPEAIDRLEALYDGVDIQLELDLLAADLQTGFSNYRPVPSNQVTLVTELISASPTCIFAEVSRDYSGVAIRVSQEFRVQWVVLIPFKDAATRQEFNPTSWAYAYDGVQEDGSAPEKPCEAS